MQGMPAFWAPSGSQFRRLTWGRARAHQRLQKKQPKKSSPQASPEMQMQQNTVNSSILWLGSRARARKPTGKKQGPRSTRASHSNSKTDRTTTNRSAQQFLKVFTAFCGARAQHRHKSGTSASPARACGFARLWETLANHRVHAGFRPCG